MKISKRKNILQKVDFNMKNLRKPEKTGKNRKSKDLKKDV